MILDDYVTIQCRKLHNQSLSLSLKHLPSRRLPLLDLRGCRGPGNFSRAPVRPSPPEPPGSACAPSPFRSRLTLQMDYRGSAGEPAFVVYYAIYYVISGCVYVCGGGGVLLRCAEVFGGLFVFMGVVSLGYVGREYF